MTRVTQTLAALVRFFPWLRRGSSRLILTTDHARRRLLAGLLVGTIVGVIMTAGLWANLFSGIRLRLQDALYQPRATKGQVVIVAIDDLSLGAYGRSTVEWDRRVHADLIRFLDDAGASVIMFDVLFADPSDPEADETLRLAMDESCRVIQPVVGRTQRAATTTAGEFFTYADVVHPIPAFEETCPYFPRPALGHATADPDDDGIVRRLPLVIVENDEFVPALSLAAFTAHQGLAMEYVNVEQNRIGFAFDGMPELPTDDFGRMLVYYFGPPSHVGYADSTFPVYSFVDVVNGDVPPEAFRGKIVLVGALDATALPDSYTTPTTASGEKMYGVEIHANAIETIIQSFPLYQARADEVDLGPITVPLPVELKTSFPLRQQPLANQLAITFFMALAAGIVLPFFRWYAGAVVVALAYGAYFFWASVSFTVWGRIVELVFPAGSLLFTFTGTVIVGYIFEERRRGQINDLFSRYVSAEIAQKIVEAFDKGRLELGGEEREITVLFADVRGFTPLSEGLPPHEVVRLLNLFLEEMNMIVMRYGGAINKYIGDNLMAFWNAPYAQDDHAWLAVQAALDMLAAIKQLNERAALKPPVQFGIGVNTGPVVVGNIGSQRRLEYTPIGDTVNVASRLCGIAEGGTCYIGARTYALLEGRARAADVHNLKLKGKEDAVTIYELRMDALTLAPPGEPAAAPVPDAPSTT